jgi:transcriptional regulator with XRE-family HTH domain
MQDFATVLLDARKRSGLTQAQLAVSAGLTPSYLSFIENRKKPPPSDEVCRRLGEVLGIPAKELIDVAHMERAPEPLRRRVNTLTQSLHKERKSRLRALKSMLSPFLFAGPPGFRESALDAIGINPLRKKRIRQVLAAVGRDHQDQEREISKLVDELPEKERALILERLPAILGRAGTGAKAPTTAPERARGPRDGEAPLLYALPEPGHEAAYRVEVDAERAAGFDDLRAGDQLVVEPGQRPGLEDLCVLRSDAHGFVVRRLVARGESFALVLDHPAAARSDGGDREPPSEPELGAVDLAALLGKVGAGTIVEVRRPLRRRRPDA